jgi:hypothetical protein
MWPKRNVRGISLPTFARSRRELGLQFFHRRLQPRHEFRIVDALIAAYGHYVDAHAPSIDQSLFREVLFNAIDGNALYEIEQASQQLRDSNAEQAYYARYNSLA